MDIPFPLPPSHAFGHRPFLPLGSARLTLRVFVFRVALGHEAGHLTHRTGLGASTPPTEHRDLPLFAQAAKYREIAQLLPGIPQELGRVPFLCVEVRAAQHITGSSADSKLLRAFSLPTRLILSPSEDTYVNSIPRSYWARARPGSIRLFGQVLDQHHRVVISRITRTTLLGCFHSLNSRCRQFNDTSHSRFYVF
jgi:hypothetical protein